MKLSEPIGLMSSLLDTQRIAQRRSVTLESLLPVEPSGYRMRYHELFVSSFVTAIGKRVYHTPLVHLGGKNMAKKIIVYSQPG
jgi:hypothetical protein